MSPSVGLMKLRPSRLAIGPLAAVSRPLCVGLGTADRSMIFPVADRPSRNFASTNPVVDLPYR